MGEAAMCIRKLQISNSGRVYNVFELVNYALVIKKGTIYKILLGELMRFFLIG